MQTDFFVVFPWTVDPLHSFQLFDPGFGAGRGGGPHQILGYIVFQIGDFLLLCLVFLFPPGHELGFQFLIFGIVAREYPHGAEFHLPDFRDGFVQEVPVMGDDNNSALVSGQMILQPEQGLEVQVVGGLVQNEQFRLTE